jgi:hypothetical protein
MLVDLWRLRLLKRIVSKSLDDADHLCDRSNDNLLCIVLEEQSEGGQYNTSKNCCEELEHGCLLALSDHLNSGVSD